MQDGHRVWVGNSMTHKSRAKHSGQVVHIHLGIHTLRNTGIRKGSKIKVAFLTKMKVDMYCREVGRYNKPVYDTIHFDKSPSSAQVVVYTNTI